MNNSKKIRKRSFRNIFFLTSVNMPKKQVRKIFKVKKKTINEDKNNFVIRFKNLSKGEQKDLRADLDIFVAGYFDYDDKEEKDAQ